MIRGDFCGFFFKRLVSIQNQRNIFSETESFVIKVLKEQLALKFIFSQIHHR